MTKPSTRRMSGWLAALALGTAVVAGCGSDSPADLIASGKAFIAKQDYKSAEIQIKSALQQDPTLGEARYLLGTVMMRLGDYSTAEKEFRKALEYKYSPEVVYPALAKSLFRSGNVDTIRKAVQELREVNLTEPAGAAALKTELGNAYLLLRQPKDARAAYDEALKAKPDDPAARIGDARLKAADGNTDAVMKIVEDVLAASPGQIDALSLKSELHIFRGETDQAVAALREVIKAEPLNGGARYALASLLIGAGKYDDAAVEVDGMKKALPQDVRWRYLEAVVAFRRGEPAKAKDPIQQVLKFSPDHIPSLLLAGAVEYQLGQFSTAEEHLRKVVARYPNHQYARAILALTYLRLGQPAKANEVIQPALARGAKNPYFLRAAGEVALANNDPKKATELYERALAESKDNVAAQVRLGVARMATGDMEGAMRDLESASARDPDATQADLGLIAAHMSRKEYDKALAIADGLAKKQPKSPLAENMGGMVLLARGDQKGARQRFERALEYQFDYLPSALNLVRMDIADKQPAKARQRLEAIVAKAPKNDQALLALADVQLNTGIAPKDVVPLIERAVAANPTSSNARLMLIATLLRSQNPKAALAAAQSAAAALPDHRGVIEALGRAQIIAGEPQQAVSTFNKLATMVPESSVPLLLAARAHLAKKDVEAAIQMLRKALALQPDRLDVHREAVGAFLAAGKPGEAMAEAKLLQKARPKEPIGFMLEGEVLASQKKLNEAANAYAEALKRQQSPMLALRQSALLTEAGKAKEGEAVLARWIRDNPKDILVRLYLADRALVRKDYATSVPLYKEILSEQPDNVIVLNNLAWALSQTKDPGAVKLAERAHELAPGNPAVADTLGVILVDQGELKRGTQLLSEAVRIAPEVSDLRLHYAQALLKAGDKAGARRELEQVVRTAGDAPANASAKLAAEQLLKQL